LEKLRGDAVRFSTGLFRAARGSFHHATVAAATNRKSGFGESAAEFARFDVVGVAFARAGTAKDGDDVFAHRVHVDLVYRAPGVWQHAAGCAPNSSTIATVRPSSVSVASWPRFILLLRNEKITRRPLGSSAKPVRVRTCSTEPVFA